MKVAMRRFLSALKERFVLKVLRVTQVVDRLHNHAWSGLF